MSNRVRRSVYSLPAGDQTLDWYRAAVAALQARPLSDPTSWWWMGAVHGQPGFTPVPGSNGFWSQCQHQTWFFLPWHRGYLAAFEATVAKTVADLGGPTDWALPYWNYSEDLATNPEARRLPPAFRDQFMPDGSPNALFAPRVADASGNVNLRDSDVSLAALSQMEFTPPLGLGGGFGGPATGFNRFGPQNGALESVPHNVLHVRIGGNGGWMSNPDTAAFDPIFWLHHCNIDRLWEEWLAADPNHFSPVDPAWLTAVSFQLHDENGQPFSFTSADMQPTTAVLHGYQYDSVPTVPQPFSPAGGAEMAQLDLEPELAGTSEGPVRLEGTTTRALVTMQTEALGRSFTETALPTPTQVYLRLEQVRGRGVPGDFDILVDLPEDDLPAVSVGILSTFGLSGASDPEADHGGGGLTQIYDITNAAERLKLTSETAPQLQVSFERVELGDAPEASFPQIEGLVTPEPVEAEVEVGRIGIYFS